MNQTRLTRKNRSYELKEYNPNWVELFKAVKAQIECIYDDNLVSVEHMGSTSIPGMMAKPQIDVLVVVKDIKKVKSVYEKFTEAGYEPRGNYTGLDEEYFTFDSNGKRLYSVHTFQEGNLNIDRLLGFRDYIKAHPKEMQQYMQIKLDLLNEFGSDDYNSYDIEKAKRMKNLKSAAEKWRNNP